MAKDAKTWVYPVKLEEDDNGTYLVTFPDFADAITFGESREDALAKAGKALREVVAARIAHREDIPLPSSKGNAFVDLDGNTQIKVALYRCMSDAGYKKADLARALHCDQKQVDRLLDVKHASSIKKIDEAFHALGKRISFGVADMSVA